MSEAMYKTKQGTGLKLLPPKQMLQRFPKAGINSKRILNQIRQIVYSLYQSKKLLKNI